MGALLQFIFVTVLILTALVVFAVIMVAGWALGTLYLWIEGSNSQWHEKEQDR